ncbi:hypothetical protein E2562_030922 [Oryza meyeriana var. granulata]|uniref:Glycosyltransferase N-terminal domain-containing protein n=1 Tax=Oryza meyeriana var. granulata TaxID=110450 RepID=A0A6G1E4S9_9ORYZ|nr:hypothetical protein E2562_030922 [Oryza meyeriana var. granulata]
MAAAAAGAANEPCRCHIVAVPFPGRGHVNAMMNLSRLLAARGAAVTFVVTEEWLGLLSSFNSGAFATPPGVRLRAIPNVIPSEHGRAADHEGFLEAVGARMEAPFERLLDRFRLEEETAAPVAAFVADSYVPWVVGVGNRRGVPVLSLFPMAAVFFSAYYHFDSLQSWLAKEHQPDSGATSVSSSQLDEIALGLATSAVRFLWILREQSTQVRELVNNTNKGMILPWCDQLKVLCHPSVGGFLTHCGMNSTLEAVFAGVPMLTLPLFFDQAIDGRLIVEEWKIGVKLRDSIDTNRLIRREEIARAVKRLMASDEAEMKAIRRHALEWKEISHRAVNQGGSSHRNLTSLMEMIRSSR